MGGVACPEADAARRAPIVESQTPYILNPHSTPYTLHPTPYTLHPVPYALHLTAQRSGCGVYRGTSLIRHCGWERVPVRRQTRRGAPRPSRSLYRRSTHHRYTTRVDVDTLHVIGTLHVIDGSVSMTCRADDLGWGGGTWPEADAARRASTESIALPSIECTTSPALQRPNVSVSMPCHGLGMGWCSVHNACHVLSNRVSRPVTSCHVRATPGLECVHHVSRRRTGLSQCVQPSGSPSRRSTAQRPPPCVKATSEDYSVSVTCHNRRKG